VKRTILLLLLLQLFNQSLAQSTFKKDYLTVGVARLNINELSTGELMTGLNTISKLDPLGNQLYSTGFTFNPFIGINSFIKLNDNEYYFDGLYGDSCITTPSQLFALGKIDTLGNVIKSKFYKLTGNCATDVVGNFDITNDNGIIKGGKTQYSNCGSCWNGHGYLIRVDSSLNVMWSKYYNNHRGYANYVKQAPDNSIMVGYNLDTAGAVIIKLDAAGNTIWSKSYFRPGGYVSGILCEPDGSSLVIGSTDLSFTKKVFILKIDSTGHVLWCRGFDSDNRMGATKIIRISDNNYIILCQAATSNLSKIVLIKTDLNGDTLWTRAHGNSNYGYGPLDFIESADKGFVISGTSQGSYPQNWTGAQFIYKTDSLGHSSCNEYNLPVYVYDLFPMDSDVVMLSVDGATAYPANITPAARSSFPTYDDCTITGISNQNNLSPQYSIHPNPSTGKVFIFRNDAYTSDCYFAVYNSLGKLLIQQKFINGNKDTEINLSRYGKGIYLIKITEGVETITKKIVIE
jgi:hypothetical protein